jgi:N-ethylmaleimide reductase
VESGYADIVAFGKAYISNPDLVHRLRDDLPLNAWNSERFYGGGADGYTDYPALASQ